MKPTRQRSRVEAAFGFGRLLAAGLLVAAAFAGCSPPSAPPPSASTAPQPEQPVPSGPSSGDETPKPPEATPVEAPSVALPVASDGTATFTLQPRQGVMTSLVNYFKPLRIALAEKPEETLVKEPQYASPKPLYGTLQLGEGPDNRITLVVDEPEGQQPRIYVDRNNDQDLTNDGSGQWTDDAGSTLRLSGVLIDVPYATANIYYTFQFYRFKDRQREFVLYYRDASREGEITSDGKSYKIAILDENANGRFDDLADGTLIIDLNQDGKLVGGLESAEHHQLGEPFNIHGRVWEVASLSPDGTSLRLRPSEAKVEMRPYLEPGYPAPKFTANDLDGKPVDLGEEAASAKYVLLDFWASWCGPCRAEFPYLRQLQARYKNHGLRIVGINLDSERDKAVQAATENGLDYRHVFDGGGWKNAVAVQYRVHGIPETFLLDRDLKILDKGLRGSQLEVRIAELLGPGDAVAPAEIEASPPVKLSPDKKIAEADATETVDIRIARDGFQPQRSPVGLPGSEVTKLVTDRPNGLAKEPSYTGSEQWYGVLTLGSPKSQEYVFCLDQQPGDTFRLYFDINRNGDLTDDGGPLADQATPAGPGVFARQVSIPWKTLVPDCPFQGDFKIWFFINEEGWKRKAVSHYSQTALRGVVSIAGKRYPTYLIDHDYNDADLTNDGVAIDVNGNGKIDADAGPKETHIIGGKAYRFVVTW